MITTTKRFNTFFCCVFICLNCMVHGFDDVKVFNAFKKTFPLQDNSELLTKQAIVVNRAIERLNSIGVYYNVSTFCSLDEQEILNVLMHAVLGFLVIEEEKQPFQIDVTTGKLVFTDNFTNNRLIIFQVLVFSLLIALARTWYVALEDKKTQKTK